MARAIRASGLLKPNPIRVMSRILVLTDSIRPLDRPCSIAARIEALCFTIRRCSFTNASIRLRLPYLEPLNLLQVELMRRHRAGEDDPRIAEGMLLSINAVATGLRNSG